MDIIRGNIMTTVWDDYKTIKDFADHAGLEKGYVISYMHRCGYTERDIFKSMFSEVERKREIRTVEKLYKSYKRVEI